MAGLRLKQVRDVVERVTDTNGWGDFFAAGASADAESLAQDLEAEHRVVGQRETFELEEREAHKQAKH
ncbi:hypothetical protein [Paracoccus nototheniae]|uniref:Uncharacterized protein n=1 Tax=Paracoccus nototheniae TaxID=2489002 RepID=A0ABW4E436_9RHOB|nr:hypothetical protein [Paracoccus nototheniae]